MKIRHKTSHGLACASFILVSFAFAEMTPAEDAPAANFTASEMTGPGLIWPRDFTVRSGTIFTIYQPQFEAWDGFTLNGTGVLTLKLEDEMAPLYGKIAFTAKTETDAQTSTVSVKNLKIDEITFPAVRDFSPEWRYDLVKQLETLLRGMPLAGVQESVAIAQASRSVARGDLKNDPPKIIFSEKPAMLIPIDGEPQWRPVNDTGFERALNTQVLLVRKDRHYYLHLWDGYLEAADLRGEWTVAKMTPPELADIEAQLKASGQVDLLDDDDIGTAGAPSLRMTPPPKIYFSTEPAELVVSSGALNWAPIVGTNLIYATNTEASLFKDITTQENFLLLSGRWFRGSIMAGKWHFLAAKNLPPDFARIPDNSPQEAVKIAVPDTPQAREAVIANSIPEVVKIERENAVIAKIPVYENDTPRLAPIENTTLFYVVNSTVPVIRVNPSMWMLCEDGVWFVADSAHGPWRVAVSVPVEIYRIPYGSPLHYVSYVRVQNYDSRHVWFACTPGYYGTIIGTSGTVVYGTGYHYAPYIGLGICVSYPASYGYAFMPVWTISSGWSFGLSVFWANRAGPAHYYVRPPAPHWGPYHDHFYAHHSPPPRQIIAPRMQHLRPAPMPPNRIGGISGKPPPPQYSTRADRASVSLQNRFNAPRQNDTRPQNNFGARPPNDAISLRPPGRTGATAGRPQIRTGNVAREMPPDISRRENPQPPRQTMTPQPRHEEVPRWETSPQNPNRVRENPRPQGSQPARPVTPPQNPPNQNSPQRAQPVRPPSQDSPQKMTPQPQQPARPVTPPSPPPPQTPSTPPSSSPSRERDGTGGGRRGR